MSEWKNIPGNHTSWWDDLRVGDQVTVHKSHVGPIDHTIRGTIASIERIRDGQDMADGPVKDIIPGSASYQYPVAIPRPFNPKRAHITNLRRYIREDES
ncbi:hypothetical protein [Bifidobacterium cuniculi]|uniref:Uncharacterized protein n=1 Tax=Bifidobacterium cuniculi TaxID=1688 RepID=A0A087B4G4_9BIFI|nr:hypothetical protein [Bifidobacterium cuniculi]KFI65914.1 hypothetical protein BCUN_0413 [Bifidobacterium cuniculi]